jgi:hypothetical protein
MNIIKTVTTFIISTLFISGVAIAEGEKLADKLENAVVAVNIEIPSCNTDAAKLCPGLTLNSKKAFMCLMAYEDNLSQACKVGIVEAAISLEMGMLAIDYSIQACEADADKHCLKVEAGEGRIVSCLKKNEATLDAKCTAALKETGLWDIAK